MNHIKSGVEISTTAPQSKKLESLLNYFIKFPLYNHKATKLKALLKPDPVLRWRIPLIKPQGYALGTLWIIDHIVREMNSQQLYLLRILASQVLKKIELCRN